MSLGSASNGTWAKRTGVWMARKSRPGLQMDHLGAGSRAAQVRASSVAGEGRRGVFYLEGETQAGEDLLCRVVEDVVPLDLVHVLQGPVGR